MPNFSSPEGDLTDLFISDIEIFEQHIGNQLWLWGENNLGQLGDNSTDHRSSPIQTVSGGTNWKQVSVMGIYTGAIKTDGTLWLWGYNYYGTLGDNTQDFKSSPIQTVAGGTNWKQVSGGFTHTACVKTDGTLWLWGRNHKGQLGNNNGYVNAVSSPIQTVAGGTNWKQVSAGSGHTACVKTDGTLWLWGNNAYGQLGDGTTTDRSSPVQTASGGTNWKQLSCGYFYTACIKTDGTLWTWGRNSNGILGNESTTNTSFPNQTVSGGTNWKQVSGGGSHTAAIKTDGTLWLWGANSYGRLGDNTTTSRSSPVQTIAGGTNWKQVSVSGGEHTAAIKTDGTLWTWGRNTNSRLGDVTNTHRSSPIQTIAAGTNWKQVSASPGRTHTAAITFIES